MRTRTTRILQQLALAAGFCAAAWLAAEGLDHGTALADAPPAIEQPGGLLDDDNTAPTTPPAEPTPPDPDPQPRPDDEQTAEPDRPPADDTSGVGEVVTPDPADGDTSTQHPGDTPPDPGPTDPPPAVIPALPEPPDPRPATPPADSQPTTPPAADADEPERPVPPAGESLEAGPPFGGQYRPAPYLPATDVQTQPSKGGEVCDSRGVTPAAPRPGTRDRLASTRGPAGPGPDDPAPCDPDGPAVEGGAPPVAKPPTAPAEVAVTAGGYRLRLDIDQAAPHGGADTTPPSRHTAWPPGPG